MGNFTFDQGRLLFLAQVGMGEKTYRTQRWGRDLQIWLMEGRDYRSPNRMLDGPHKSLWGQRQKQWLKESMAASDATFKLVISPTPIVGPDAFDLLNGTQGKKDNHADRAFGVEGAEIRRWLADLDNGNCAF